MREFSPDRQRAPRYGDRRYNLANNSTRSPSFRQYGVGRPSGVYENKLGGYRTMPNSYRSPERTYTGDLGHRFPQPKRIRFSEYLQQQNSNSSRGQNGSLSPQQSFVSEKKAVRGDNLNTGTKVHAPQNQN